MIGIPLGLLYTNAGEWFLHKYVLHGQGKRKDNFWSFHWSEHHRACRKNNFYDPDYLRGWFQWNAQGKEALAVTSLALLHIPLFPIAPFFTITVWCCQLNYLLKHKKAHLNPEWGKKNLRWHYDHHMGRDQDANWCVTAPWFDLLMGTRKKYDYAEPNQTKSTPAMAAE